MNSRNVVLDLALALDILERAGEMIRADFRSGVRLDVSSKEDGTLVSATDLRIEALVRDLLMRERPQDTLWSEESGIEPDSTRTYTWILDPIDGTTNFTRGNPICGPVIALAAPDRSVVVGGVSAPMLNLRWYAARGRGAYRNDERIRVSSTTRLSEALMSHGNLTREVRAGKPLYSRLAREVAMSRSFGDFLAFALVADGSLDVAIELDLHYWDFAGMIPIVEEAGGVLRNLSGDPPVGDSSVFASNRPLAPAILECLGVSTDRARDALPSRRT